jgi:hypothetical protein
MNSTDYIPLHACEKGRLYRVRARNFHKAVFNGKDGFIGIRKKFGHTYLFTEYHWDTGETYGTVKPVEALDFKMPEDIPVVEYLGTYDGDDETRMLEFFPENGWKYTDTGESLPNEKYAYSLNNTELLKWLNTNV